MTDKLYCCFCGAELMINPRPFDGCVKGRCVNGDCRYAEWTFPLEIWQALIDGKKAQRQLRTVKDRCVHKIKAKDKTIDDCLHGIHVRNLEIENLQKQLQKAQEELDRLKEIKEYLYERFFREKDGFLVNWDVVAKWIHDTITYSTKQENE